MKIISKIFLLVLFLALMIIILKEDIWADQVIMVDMMFFIPDKSEYIMDEEEHEDALDDAIGHFRGNVWDVFKDGKALGGAALGAPGDNSFDSNPALVYKLPVAVKAGEPAKWKMWARLNRTADPNSFYWMASQDAENWTPRAFNIDTHGWNNPAAMVPAKAPWFWFDGVGSPDLKAGDNYIMVSARESGVPPDVNLIDVIMIRNDGQKPTDAEAEKLLAEQYAGLESPLGEFGDGKLEEDQAVTPGSKLSAIWGRIKSQ